MSARLHVAKVNKVEYGDAEGLKNQQANFKKMMNDLHNIEHGDENSYGIVADNDDVYAEEFEVDANGWKAVLDTLDKYTRNLLPEDKKEEVDEATKYVRNECTLSITEIEGLLKVMYDEADKDNGWIRCAFF